MVLDDEVEAVQDEELCGCWEMVGDDGRGGLLSGCGGDGPGWVDCNFWRRDMIMHEVEVSIA